MNNNTIFWILGALAIIAFIIVLIIQSLKKKLIQTVSKLQNNFSLFSNSDVGKNLNALLTALGNASQNSSEILEKLRSNPLESVKELTNAFTELPESAYNTKWVLVYCISQFELPEFINLLSRIANSDIPNEKSQNIHLFSTVAEETTIRLTAIDGLKGVAQKGYKDAEIVLFDLLKSKYLTLNIASCQGLAEISAENKARIIEILPKEKQFIINIERKNISEIPFMKSIEEDISLNKKYVPKPQAGENNVKKVSEHVSISKPPKIIQ